MRQDLDARPPVQPLVSPHPSPCRRTKQRHDLERAEHLQRRAPVDRSEREPTYTSPAHAHHDRPHSPGRRRPQSSSGPAITTSTQRRRRTTPAVRGTSRGATMPASTARRQRDAPSPCRPEHVLAAIETGRWCRMAGLPTRSGRATSAPPIPHRQTIGTALAPARLGGSDVPRPELRCLRPRCRPRWYSVGDFEQREVQDTASARLTGPADVPRLEARWAVAVPSGVPSSQGDTHGRSRIFVGGLGGKVYWLDESSGCVHWFLRCRQRRALAISIVNRFRATSPSSVTWPPTSSRWTPSR